MISDVSMAVKARDVCCRITGSTEAGDTAHIIPVKENDWFEDQKMYTYSKDVRSINSTGNQLLLKCDLHRTHEQFKWVIFPNGDKWVYYAIDNSVELASLYHQRELRSLRGIMSEYLLAAFARAIFPKLSEFLRSRVDKYLLGVDVGTENATTGVKIDGASCAERFRMPGRPRSNSPKKRGSPSKEDGGSPRKKGRQALGPVESSGKRQRSCSSDHDFAETQSIPKHKKKRYRHPQYTGPCICPILPPSPLATPPSDRFAKSDDGIIPAQPSEICLSDHCRTQAELDRLEQLRQETLKRERLISDPEGNWENHLEWAKDPIAVQDVNRWLWVGGQEVLDSDLWEFVGLEAPCNRNS